MTVIKKGSTDVTRYVMLRDSADGTPETAYTITSLDLQYTRNRAAAAAKADATALAAVDSAHGDNQAIQVNATSSPGLYRIDWPDAAFATGVDKVLLVVSGAGLDPAVEEIDLVDYDPADGVRLGLTAMPNAAADAAGGLPISDAGGLDLDARLDAAVSSRMPTTHIDATAGKVDGVALVDVTTTNTDMRGTDNAFLAASAPSNFGDMSITATTGLVDITQTAADKAWGTSSRTLTAFDAGFKTGYALSSAGVQAIWDALTSALTAVGSVGKIIVDNLNATVSSRSSHNANNVRDAILSDSTPFAGANVNATIGSRATQAEVLTQVNAALDATIADSVAADGSRPSLRQAAIMTTRFLMERGVVGTTVTVTKEDGTTASMTFTLDDGTTPTSITRAS